MNKNIKYCPRCGHPTAKTTKFCTHCGYQFKDVTKEDTESHHTNQENQNKQSTKTPTRTEHDKSEFTQPPAQYTYTNPHMSTKAKVISGICALVLACGIGIGAFHHHDTIHQQQTTQQQNSNNSNQQNNQNSNQNNNSNNQPQPSNKQQATHVLFNLMSMIRGCSQGQNQVSQLEQLYDGGSNNSSYQQMAKWCKSLDKANTSVQLGYSNFHLHKIGNHEFEETYKAYYEFTHSNDNPDIDGSSTTQKCQIVPWHTIIKKTKGDDWEIIKSNSSKNVSNASTSEVEPHLIET